MIALSVSQFSRAADINDGGGFFSKAAIEKSLISLKELETKYETEIRIETLAEVPDGKADEVTKMSVENRGRYFNELLIRRITETGAKGIYVLICKKPSHVRVRAHINTNSGQAIASSMQPKFKEKDFDGGLADGIAAIGAELSRHKSTSPAPIRIGQPKHGPHQQPAREAEHPARGRENSGAVSMVTIIAIFVGIFVLMMVVGRLFSGAQGYGGGGGMMGGLLTGLFGAMAGHWIYDSFFSNHNQAWGNEGSNSWGNDSTSGSDFGGGSDMGGGDFGGGDFGGGDFGGGDFGGGDFGGGDF